MGSDLHDPPIIHQLELSLTIEFSSPIEWNEENLLLFKSLVILSFKKNKESYHSNTIEIVITNI